MAVVPFSSPLAPEASDAVDKEHVELLVGLLVDVGELSDVASEDLQLLFDEVGFSLHGGDVLSESIDVAAYWKVHAVFGRFAAEHFL